MYNLLKDKNIQSLAGAIADSKNSVPAGGTTIASSAFLAISLLELVIEVSEKELSDQKKENLQNAQERLKKYKDILLKAVDDDVAAYQKNLTNKFTDAEDLIEIIAVPLDIAEACCNSLLIAAELKEVVKPAVKADYEISKYNLEAAVKGSIAVIESNYSFFSENSDYLLKVKERAAEIKAELNNL